jgi:hypothetical protein
MSSKLLLPVTLPLRLAALQMRLVRSAAELALEAAKEMTDRAPWAGARDDDGPMAATRPPVPEPSATPPEADPVEPVRAARAPQAKRTTSRSRPAAAANGADPAPAEAPRARRATTRTTRPAATPPTPPADTEPPPKPRARRTARKATAAKPASRRKSGPTRGEAAAIREANREAEGQAASAGPAEGAGPHIHVEAPWDGYDAMPLDAVLARLADADETLLAAVRLYESTHESRQAVLLATEPSS